jgi:hypothetical protein
MERAKLKEIGLTDEQIEAVMADHGKAVNAALDGKAALTAKVTELEGKLTEYADYSALKEEVATLRAGNEELATLRAEKESRDYGDRLTAAMNGRQFVNGVTRDHVFGKFVEAAKDPANNGKNDADLLAAVIGDNEADYIKSKVSITMTPTQTMQRGKDTTANGIEMIPYKG